jgi:WD40 repeat protein
MATYSGGKNAFPRVSPDGRWLAIVVTSPNNENQLQVWDTSDPSVAPIILKAGSKDDTISSMEFTPDSSRLLVIAGGSDTADNSLIAIELASGNDFRIARGHFGGSLTISPDGKEVALLDWQKPEDPKQPAYANTVIIGVDSSDEAILYKGADIVDGKVTNLRFAAPLVWRQAAS